MPRTRAPKTNDLICRPFEPSDFDAVCDLIAKVWHTEGSSEETFLSSRSDASYYLSVSQYLCVAEKNHKIVGLIFAGNGENNPTTKPWRLIKVSAQHLAEALEGSRYYELNYQYIKTESKLIKAFRCSNDPRAAWEITLFCIDPQEQGHGIGGLLFSKVIDFFISQNARGFFLATDDGCDFSFYDYKGLERVSSAEVFPAEDYSETAYLYALDL